MSLYVRNLSKALVDALARVPSTQPSQVAGYWANRGFWIKEFFHLLDVMDGYDDRLAQMQRAQDAYLQTHDGPHNHDEFGNPKQQVRDTTNPSSRRFAASEARTVLKALADRALDLHIATSREYNEFLSDLRITNRRNSPGGSETANPRMHSELPIGRLLKSRSLGGNRVILILRREKRCPALKTDPASVSVFIGS